MTTKQLFPSSIHITEVGPRDGLQNEKQVLSLEQKIDFVEGLIAAGHKNIELGSFVREDRVPQMAGTSELVKAILPRFPKTNFSCLVPNKKGMELAIESGIKEVAFFTATSETFNQKNIGCTIDESFERLDELRKLEPKKKIRGYVSTVFGCPYEGETSVKKCIEVSKKLLAMGCYEIVLSDTIGSGTPSQTEKILNEIEKSIDKKKIALHFHDTRGMALTNIYVALQKGYDRFDAAAGGLGGCPYAQGASGNVATEDVVYLCESLGINTGIDMKNLARASLKVLDIIKKKPGSKFLEAYRPSI